MTEYFTYLIGWSKLNYWYYGCRYKKNTNSSSLWRTYFTSSKLVNEMRIWHGEPDVIQIRCIFKTKEQTLRCEEKVIRKIDAIHSDRWLNRNVGGVKFRTSNHSEETKLKISIKAKGRVFSELHKLHMSHSRAGVKRGPCSEERRKNISLSRIGIKRPGIGGAKKGDKFPNRKRPTPVSIETRKKLSKSVKLAWAEGRRV